LINKNRTNINLGITWQSQDQETKKDSFCQNLNNKKSNQTHKGKEKSKRKEEENLKLYLKNKYNKFEIFPETI